MDEVEVDVGAEEVETLLRLTLDELCGRFSVSVSVRIRVRVRFRLLGLGSGSALGSAYVPRRLRLFCTLLLTNFVVGGLGLGSGIGLG